MIEQLKDAMDKVDRTTIERWVRDLVLVKTFVGLRFQKAILAKLAVLKDTSYRFAVPGDESRGIDGYVGKIPVSIKPVTYKLKAELAETIQAKIVYYTKLKDGIEIEFDF